MSITEKAARVKLILLDVDGVLTDGKILLHADGSESKRFDIKDGLAIVWAQRAGLTVGFLSARNSTTTLHRATQLGIVLYGNPLKSREDHRRHPGQLVFQVIEVGLLFTALFHNLVLTSA